MTDITSSIEIDRPADEVFAFLADMANNPSWQKGQQRCAWTSPPPLAVGSTYDQEARFLGRTITSSFEVTELEPGRRIRIETVGGPMAIDVTRTAEPLTEKRSRVTARVRGSAPGPLRLLGPLLDRIVRRNVDADYRRLKSLLEQDQRP
jgi:uncharacterized membrane protein